jgi:xylose isomerase
MAYEPTKADRFTFGLWTLGNPGRDPFGDPVRTGFKPVEIVEKLGAMGAMGVNFHDNDLVPFGATAQERDRIVAEFKTALANAGMTVPMATTNLFGHPAFKDGAFTSNDPEVRAFAYQKVMRSMDLGAEFGAKTYVFWGGREGAEVDASKDAVTAVKRMRDALNFFVEYSEEQGYGYKFALEAKPNEPRGDIYLPTTGAMLGFIATLDKPEMVGVNPEVAHETISGLNFYHAVAQALEAGKLFHIDLNGQKPGRFDQDLRFGQEDSKNAFFLVRLLENYGYNGPLHFDAHALRTSDPEDVLQFARGCMRSYLILKEKAKQFDADSEVQEILAQIHAPDSELEPMLTGYSKEKAQTLKGRNFDADALAAKPLPYERLDQKLFDILMGVA